MTHISEQQLTNRVKQLTQDHNYIDELTADMFECDPKKELIKYGDPETWKQL